MALGLGHTSGYLEDLQKQSAGSTLRDAVGLERAPFPGFTLLVSVDADAAGLETTLREPRIQDAEEGIILKNI